MSDQEIGELQPSELGTKEYWDSAYKVEVENFKNHGDVGEVWFGEDCGARIVRWLENSSSVPKDSQILDIGCGNGMLLIELAEEGFTNLTGIDYSSEGISLAKSISEQKGFTSISFMTGDILGEELPSSKYDVILDKGTYDAISLSPENTNAKRLAYTNSVKKLLQHSGLFIITSCNWTEEELKHHFKSDFVVASLIPSPKFQFGGKVGNSVTTIVFHNKL